MRLHQDQEELDKAVVDVRKAIEKVLAVDADLIREYQDRINELEETVAELEHDAEMALLEAQTQEIINIFNSCIDRKVVY